jgi:hypothetical protein
LYNEDYFIRYGSNTTINRSDYMTLKEAEKEYNRKQLNINTIWKELIYEPLEQEEVQNILKSDSVKVIDLGICKVIIPE